MKVATVKSGSKKKINLPSLKPKDNGAKELVIEGLTDEEMAQPGPVPSKELLDAWLAKDDGEKYGIDEAFSAIRREYVNVRKPKKS